MSCHGQATGGRQVLRQRLPFRYVDRGFLKDDDMTKKIAIEITSELLESLIIRRLAIVFGEGADVLASARRMAEELRAILTDYLDLFSVRPPDRYPEPDGFTKADFMFAILRTTLGWWPEDNDAAGQESIWIMGQFDRVDGQELYDRWLKLADQINGTNIADIIA
jgi:hypothetical protein